MLNSMNCRSCGMPLKKDGSIFYCDNCKTIAYPNRDSRKKVEEKICELTETINKLIKKNEKQLHRIEQENVYGYTLSDKDQYITSCMELYWKLKKEIELNVCIDYATPEHQRYEFIKLAEDIISLLTTD